MVFPRFSYAVLLIVALLVSGCAQLTGTRVAETPEEAVTRLSQERLELMRAGDFDVAYNYMSPGFRALKSLNGFKMDNRGARRWSDARVKSVRCEIERCQAVVEVVYVHVAAPTARPSEIGRASAPNIVTTLNEVWVQAEGSWRLFKSY